MYGSSNAAPVAEGVQSGMWTPFGTNMNAIRSGAVPDLAAAAATARAGAIASSIGRAMVAPMPRKKCRLESCLLMAVVYIMIRPTSWEISFCWQFSRPPPERIAGDDLREQHGKLLSVLVQFRRNPLDHPAVVGLGSTPQGVS